MQRSCGETGGEGAGLTPAPEEGQPRWQGLAGTCGEDLAHGQLQATPGTGSLLGSLVSCPLHSGLKTHFLACTSTPLCPRAGLPKRLCILGEPGSPAQPAGHLHPAAASQMNSLQQLSQETALLPPPHVTGAGHAAPQGLCPR